VAGALHAEMDRVSQSLTTRVKERCERYEMTLSELVKQTATFEAKVKQHLERMGFQL
jgi:type I restriction enzyme M protein